MKNKIAFATLITTLMTSAAGFAAAPGYQCAFNTDQAAYYSIEFNLKSGGAPIEGTNQNVLEKNYELNGNKITMRVQQIGQDQITLAI